MNYIAPSILNADFAHLHRSIEMFNASEADWIHLDIMDGVFVPNISFGMPVVAAVSRITTKPLDAHLMIVQPEKFIAEFKQLGVNILTVQYEACTHLHRTLQQIQQAGMKAGVAINPHTPVSVLEEIAAVADLVLVMSVNPGFGGQKFIANSADKVARAKDLLLRKKSAALIEVDGGVNRHNARLLRDAGADILVVGNAILAANNPTEEIAVIKNL
ncbi:ribulose-phosphate 3-epimerase [Bacteroidia bacterium]|nr:ribulose-phosphate 3-epimerase [Bacteroidia bacterium]